jgi:hypothetical protein
LPVLLNQFGVDFRDEMLAEETLESLTNAVDRSVTPVLVSWSAGMSYQQTCRIGIPAFPRGQISFQRSEF